MASPCDFCDEFSGGQENSFQRIYAGARDTRALFSSRNFVIVPSLGQISEGHLLLLPARHWTALGDLPESLFQEFTSLCNAVTAILREEYGPCITFEHGTRSADAGGCGIYHAHLHAVPFPVALDPIDSLKSRFPCEQLGDLAELPTKSEGMPGYLLYQDSHSSSYLFTVSNLPSQYMRRALVGTLGKDDWDWRKAGREERLLATLSRLSKHFDAWSACAGTRETTHGNSD
jgi:diadenosine tetraphosphate (Ap4A) HIT family hydrolase